MDKDTLKAIEIIRDILQVVRVNPFRPDIDDILKRGEELDKIIERNK